MERHRQIHTGGKSGEEEKKNTEKYVEMTKADAMQEAPAEDETR